jgi:D-alanyl-D-alanine dipeptidase
MKQRLALLAVVTCCAATSHRSAPVLPSEFVYLSDVAPTIAQDIRYAGAQNAVGRKLPGYLAPACILTEPAARALAKAQAELIEAGLTLRVYDCYQPQRAIRALYAWSRDESDQRMKAEYYPRVEKSRLFALGYLSEKSPHARGSSVDLTVERLSTASPLPWVPGTHSCIAPFMARYHDGSIDMGTSYDCLDPLSRVDARVGAVAGTHRAMLADLMRKYGFKPVGGLWWSFLLASEPFPRTAFDFPITAK